MTLTSIYRVIDKDGAKYPQHCSQARTKLLCQLGISDRRGDRLQLAVSVAWVVFLIHRAKRCGNERFCQRRYQYQMPDKNQKGSRRTHPAGFTGVRPRQQIRKSVLQKGQKPGRRTIVTPLFKGGKLSTVIIQFEALIAAQWLIPLACHLGNRLELKRWQMRATDKSPFILAWG